MTPVVALTVAGSDCSGAAGIQADLPTFAALGVVGASAVTAVTAQDSRRVERVEPVPIELLEAQIDAVLGDLAVAALKTGLLPSADHVAGVVRSLSRSSVPRVVDPVLVDSNGEQFVSDPTVEAYRDPHVLSPTVLTPNLHEAAILIRTELHTVEDVLDHAEALGQLAPAVVVTGGRFGGPTATDIMIDRDGVVLHERPRIDTVNVRGSGCTFSAALTAYLATGSEPRAAVDGASRFAHDRVAAAAGWDLTAGRGPVAHLLDLPVGGGEHRG